MKILSEKTLLWFCALMIALSGISCRQQDRMIENAYIPRLMIEKKGVNYGAMSGVELRLPHSGTEILVEQLPLVNEFEIRNVELVKVDLGRALLLQMTEKGARNLFRGTVTGNGSYIVLTINGNPIGIRHVDGAIDNGNFYTFVELPDEKLGQLVLNMKETLRQLKARK